MSAVNVEIVRDFIMQNALHGPERVSRDGQYDKDLIKPASIASDTEDTDLCPETNMKSLDLFWYGKNLKWWPQYLNEFTWIFSCSIPFSSISKIGYFLLRVNSNILKGANLADKREFLIGVVRIKFVLWLAFPYFIWCAREVCVAITTLELMESKALLWWLWCLVSFFLNMSELVLCYVGWWYFLWKEFLISFLQLFVYTLWDCWCLSFRLKVSALTSILSTISFIGSHNWNNSSGPVSPSKKLKR